MIKPMLIYWGTSGTLIVTAASRNVVAKANGIANHARPPIKKPLNADFGAAAMARYQYA
jgi:hypothetical protein